jgi:serine/threonine protein kinase
MQFDTTLSSGPSPSYRSGLEAGMEPYPGCRLRHLLGRGGFSEVWEALMPGGELRALKFIPCDDSRNASREIRSIQMVRQLQHPNLVHIDAIWICQSYIVVAMELAEGSLADLLSAYRSETGGPLDPETAGLLLGQVADALDFLNARRHRLSGQSVAIQHCDIKPSNLLLFGATAKLSDFGLCSTQSGCLQRHRRAGTTAYAAPEVFQGQLSDKTDQFALAVTYCELRGGRLPFPDVPASMSPTYIRPPADLTMVSQSEKPILLRALDSVPQNRWQSCSDFMTRLMAAVT